MTDSMRSSAALRNPHHAGAAWDPCNQYSLGDIPQRFPSEKQRSFSLGRLLYPLYPAGPKIGGGEIVPPHPPVNAPPNRRTVSYVAVEERISCVYADDTAVFTIA